MVLGSMQQLKVYDKYMTYITLFRSDHGYYPHFVDIIRALLISTFRGYYMHFIGIVDISAFRGYYLYCHITNYLSRNVCPIFHIYSFSVSD